MDTSTGTGTGTVTGAGVDVLWYSLILDHCHPGLDPWTPRLRIHRTGPCLVLIQALWLVDLQPIG